MNTPGTRLAEAKTVLREMVAEAQELKQAAGGSVTDAVATWLAPQYLLAARETLAGMSGAGRLEVLRTFVQDWALLRRGDHAAARLQLDREQLDWERANHASRREQEFREWIRRPEVRRELLPELKPGISPEALEKMERALHLL